MSHRLENDLLVCVARRELNQTRREQLATLLADPLDWNYLLPTADQHGLIPLLHKHLSSLPETENKTYSTAVEDDAFRNTKESLYLTGQLVRLNRKFRSAGIRVLAFKGPLLSYLAYGDVSLRRAGDLDLLIERHDYDRAKELLESQDYKMTPSLSRSQELSHLKAHCEMQFVGDRGFSVVDLHWELAPKTFAFKLSAHDVFNNSQVHDMSGESFETFGKEDMILYQCMHGAKHLWIRFEWISAIAELLRWNESIEWGQLLDRAAGCHGKRMLALGLRLVQLFYEVPVPDSVFNRIDADNTMQRMAVEIRPNIFRTRLTRPESIETGAYNFRIMDRKRDACLSLTRAIFVPTLADWESINLPSVLHPLYYAYRPYRLAKLYLSTLRQRLRKGNFSHSKSQVVQSDGA